MTINLLYSNQQITIDEIYLAIAFAKLFLFPVPIISINWTSIQSSLNAIDHILDILEFDEEEGNGLILDEKPMIKLKNVSFGYNPNNLILRDIDLHK